MIKKIYSPLVQPHGQRQAGHFFAGQAASGGAKSAGSILGRFTARLANWHGRRMRFLLII
ncbi:MAG TPA: hypothetical protein DCP03_08170 [Polaromonas sp.]|nr:hypothetical protein [Polaromonas sp.]